MDQLTLAQQIQQFAANHTLMVVAWVALFVAVLINFYKGATSKIKVVDNAQATQLINNEDAVVLDVRSDDEFRAGHIIDSLHLIPSEIKGNKTQSIDKHKEKSIIVVDNNGLSAQGLANTLAKQGFNKVYVLKEGIAGWRAANLPLVKKHK
ncbi:rhodanese-like domain-containing protein [Ursidibacter maritimus]|uniref:Rhodanese-like domain-containing protein n=1 Tax=Ursidibacter maritimus TaxID=1331689 RepID=A0A949T793_9PAST|nr:rhodanese-like domain-containing protein [Ursidibacter maritimus]KAE9541518.1 rhodanese-like domain-containing protein [Ursidibacter maritimus]MBV6524381.1 rhodanese-like domain-containing protein [Ursidibacter maritimus]MBV6526061.1 rhodanese-like domain-containing protein [Ursidibacter maritimus]MBV6528362.1 rhodanese-like domain-containing protein [Ursidibacter maritimus]MBV6529598.1 rhodanese-like domain-containing protein [Ursidibacter maritimus]